MREDYTEIKDYGRVFEKIFLKIKKDPDNFELYNGLYWCCNREDAEIDVRWDMCKRLRFLCAKNAHDSPIKDKLQEMYREVLLVEAKMQRFDSYMQYIELDREPGKRFWLPRRKQLLYVCDAIQDLIDDKLDTLTISLPPGTGKSTLEIFLHSMLIGANPDRPSLASGHSGVLTNSIYEGVLGIITDPEYLWHDVYPNAGAIITNAKEQTIDIGKKHRFSSLTCRAINASLTGATRCEQILTADDLVSGIEEAMSIPRLDKLWQGVVNDLFSRRKHGCKTLMLATRWSVHDPIGRLEQMYRDNPRYKFIVCPALNENDESNFEYDYNVGFSTGDFREMRENLDDASFKALYMNEPIEREGLLYPEDSLRRYFQLPEGEPDAIISVCDTKGRGGDYCVMPVGYVYGNDYYIDDVICDDSLPEIIEGRLIDCLLRNNTQMSRFESNAAGEVTSRNVQKGIKEKGGRCKITTKYTTANKETKIVVNENWVKEHCLFKDKSLYRQKEDYGKFMSMLCSYVLTGKNKHDDAPDAMAMFSEYAQSFLLQKVELFRRPF